MKPSVCRYFVPYPKQLVIIVYTYLINSIYPKYYIIISHIIKTKIINKIFYILYTLSLKSNSYFLLTAQFNLDELHFKHSIDACH